MSVTATDPTSLNALLGVKTATAGSSSSTATATEQSDRFLKLLVTQMKNQDPLNPMDNAQITSQMAQISTVSGIDKLAASFEGMNALMMQTQSLEGAALVGKDVLVAGNKLTVAADGSTDAGFELDAAARSVVVTIKDANGKVVDTIGLDNVAAGRHTFDWTSPNKTATGLTFEVSARNGDATVGATKLVVDQVSAVYMESGQLNIALKSNGTVKYSDVKGVS